MLVLGIDPGSVVTGWALLKSEGRKIHYISSGVLEFNGKVEFLDRLTQIKIESDRLLSELNPDQIAFESLIYVKSPTALIKLAQTRGILLSSMVKEFEGRIYEYSPNLVKSTAVGHGHADKESVRKVLDLIVGKRDYKTHDESDAVAIAVCHIMNSQNKLKPQIQKSTMPKKAKGSRSLASSLQHKIK